MSHSTVSTIKDSPVDPFAIDFEKSLLKGRKIYNKSVGQWWQKQSHNGPHSRAYRRIADYIRSVVKGEPRIIMDYGCGCGQMLLRLYDRFPKSHLIGLDGSSFMLAQSAGRLHRRCRDYSQRVHLLESNLPNFSLPAGQADLVIFIFPNICFNDEDQLYYDRHGYKKRTDTKVAKLLAGSREPDPDDETVFDDPETIFHALMTNRVIARNIRGLLRKGGLCIRAEYANAHRHEMSKLVQNRSEFEEGSLRGHNLDRFFHLIKHDYFRSRVIEDVYHQTRDENDRVGGFFINVLRAI